MSATASDRALQRLVTQLAQVSAEDVEAILDDLSEEQRGRVRRLLQVQLGETPPTDDPTEPALTAAQLPGLSPWLAARLDRACGRPAGAADASRARGGLRARGRTAAFEMTPHALAMLLESAEHVSRTGVDAVLFGEPSARRSRLPDAWARLFGGAGR